MLSTQKLLASAWTQMVPRRGKSKKKSEANKRATTTRCTHGFLPAMVSVEGSSGTDYGFEPDQDSGSSLLGTQAESSPYAAVVQEQHNHHNKPRRHGPFKCTHCHDEFYRRWELNRHTSTKHRKEKPFVCTVAGCFKKRAPPAFARSDKLTDHYKSVHKRDELAKCPQNGCGKRFLLEFTGAHIYHAHHSSGLVEKELRPLRNAFDADRRACPWWNCRARVELVSFMEHILSHSTDELNRMEESMRQENYFYVRSGCSHQAIVDGNHKCPVTAVCILCPVCREVSGNHAAFEQHVFARHLLMQTAAESEHFYQWQNHAVSIAGMRNATLLCTWKPWPIHSSDDHECPFCRKFFKGRRDSFGERRIEDSVAGHHLTLLRKTEEVVTELYPYRQAIIRLCPGFKSHPVFADLR